MRYAETGVNLEIEDGEFVSIMGPSGSGKSTLIRCINRLEEHQRGRILVDGVELGNDLKNIDRIRSEVGMEVDLAAEGRRLGRHAILHPEAGNPDRLGKAVEEDLPGPVAEMAGRDVLRLGREAVFGRQRGRKQRLHQGDPACT